MSLYIKQKIFTWGDKFSVYDENGNEKYYVRGEVFTLGKKLHLYDKSGNELAFIEQKPFSFLPKFNIIRRGCDVAQVIKEFTFFKQRYTVDGFGWLVQGNFFDHAYEITRGGTSVASVSKEWFTLGDAYEIRFAEGADEVNVLSVVLVIDACIAAQNNN